VNLAKKPLRSASTLALAPALLRTVLLAAVAVAGCVWALLRAYAPRPAPSPPPVATEIPAPELVPAP